MKQPSEQESSLLLDHTRAANYPSGYHRFPPYPLALALWALIGPGEKIIASHTLYDWDGSTRWRLWAFTDTVVAYIEATYAEAEYDLDEDRQRRDGQVEGQPIDPEPTAWVRPVSAISVLAVDTFRFVRNARPLRERTTEAYPASVRFEFSDGGSTAITVGVLDQQQARDRWELFVSTARDALSRKTLAP